MSQEGHPIISCNPLIQLQQLLSSFLEERKTERKQPTNLPTTKNNKIGTLLLFRAPQREGLIK